MTIETPSTQANNENTQEQKSAAQARIDELTAQKYALQEQATTANQRYAEMAQRQLEMEARIAQLQQTRQAQPVVDPLDAYRNDVDPKVLEAIKATQEATTRRLQQEHQARMAAIERQNALYQLQQIGSQPGIPPEVAQQAQALLNSWLQAGYSFVTPTDALHMALGQYSAGQLKKAAPSMGYNPSLAPTVTPGIQPPVQVNKGPTRPANFDSLPSQKQMEFFEAAGIGDQPL